MNDRRVMLPFLPFLKLSVTTRLKTRQKIQRTGRILGPFFQKRNQALDGVFSLFGSGGRQRVVHFNGQDYKNNLGQCGRTVKMDVTSVDTLTDDLCLEPWSNRCYSI